MWRVVIITDDAVVTVAARDERQANAIAYAAVRHCCIAQVYGPNE